MMSEKALSSIDEALPVEEQVIDTVDDTDDAIVEIIKNVEIKLIQEEINVLKEEKSLIKDWSKKKNWAVWLPFALSIPAVFVLSLFVFENLFGDVGTVLTVLMTVIYGLFKSADLLHKNGKPYYARKDKDRAISAKRRELFEKSLNAKLVYDDSIIDEEWKEIVAFDENEDYIKFLSRVVEDEESCETIEAKRLKS